jgi:hypothetical protein
MSLQNSHLKLLEASNARLKSGKLGFKIEVTESNFLCLRGTLPPKPGVNKPASTQRIFLSYPVTPEAIKQAEKDAIAVFGWGLFGKSVCMGWSIVSGRSQKGESLARTLKVGTKTAHHTHNK